jgi:predicted negative regulator of RcsB-dependent stress response
MRIILTSLVGVLLISGCSLMPFSKSDEQEQREAESAEALKKYLSIAKLNKTNKSRKALEEADKFIAEGSRSKYLHMVKLERGKALIDLSEWEKATDQFKETLELTTGKSKSLEAYSVYYLSICLEAQGKDAKVVAAILDLKKRKKYLEKEIVLAELPARLAAAYARLGQQEQAEINYKKAERGLRKLQRELKGKRKMPPWYAKLLFNMGYLSIRTIRLTSFAKDLEPLERGQGYLVKAAELNHRKWSKKASGELITVYRNIWDLIQAVPVIPNEDKVYAEKIRQQRKKEMSLLIRENLVQLKKIKMPENRNEYVREIYSFVDDMEKTINDQLYERSVSQGLTPEAAKRQGIKGRGVVYDPKGRLEKGRILKLPEKKKK